MEGRLLFKRCSVLRSGGQVTRDQAVLVEDTRITRVAPDAEIVALPGDWVVPCAGRLVMPGLVDCHSQLLAPLKSRGAPNAGEVAAICAHSLALALRSGVTTHLEHLHAPHAVEVSLAAQAAVARRLGARMIQSHASSTIAELDANAAAIKALDADGPVRCSLGLWSSSRCDDPCLTHAGELRAKLDCGVHLRLAESEEDLGSTFSRFRTQVAARLDTFGLLTPRSVGAFARALDGPGAQLAAGRGALIAPWLDSAHTPGFEGVLGSSVALGGGSAGERRIWSAIASATVAAAAVARAGRVDQVASLPWQMLFDGPARLLSAVFGGAFGAIAPGATADLIVLDAVEAGSAIGWDRLALAPVAWAIVAGRVVLREGQLLGVDFTALATDAAQAVESVWARA